VSRLKFVVLAVGLTACGAYDSSTPISELDGDQQVEVCTSYGVQDSVLAECGSPIPVRVDPLEPAACVEFWMPEGCEVTVGEWQACQDAIAADPCALQTGVEACAPLQSCGVDLWASSLGLHGDMGFSELSEDDILSICEVVNDYEEFSVECEDRTIRYIPDPQLCANFGFGGCGDVAQIFECQIDILNAGEANCEALPPSCLFDQCSF